MRVDDFDFDLPPERIALEPVRPRDKSRLLHVAPGAVNDCVVNDRAIADLPAFLNPGDMLVLNDTKVIPAQLTGLRRARDIGGGGDVTIDVTLHKKISDARWRAFIRPAKRLREGDVIVFDDAFSAVVDERDNAEAVLRFNLCGAAFDDALSRTGAPPLPPYIARKRAVNDHDTQLYQTVFAKRDGSVAAPTAGLHFTQALLSDIAARGAAIETITLHVGAGTFLPVTAEDTADHKMHSEWGEITAGQAERINMVRAGGGRIMAVGTTSLRLLESAADAAGIVRPFCGETDIFITPGYRFRAVDLLLTNFHLPRSTLFMLVCAFAGTAQMKSAYKHAIEAAYRFYSYGDACLLEKNDAS